MGFIDLEKAYDRVNKEALWQVLRMYEVGGKPLGGVKSKYVDSLVCVRVKGGESEWFRIDCGVRRFVVEVCRKRGLKVNAAKSKVMVMNGEEGLECEVHVDGVRLEHVSEFKYLGCVLDESGRDGGRM